jgi:hypothetical protein
VKGKEQKEERKLKTIDTYQEREFTTVCSFFYDGYSVKNVTREYDIIVELEALAPDQEQVGWRTSGLEEHVATYMFEGKELVQKGREPNVEQSVLDQEPNFIIRLADRQNFEAADDICRRLGSPLKREILEDLEAGKEFDYQFELVRVEK